MRINDVVSSQSNMARSGLSERCVAKLLLLLVMVGAVVMVVI